MSLRCRSSCCSRISSCVANPMACLICHDHKAEGQTRRREPAWNRGRCAHLHHLHLLPFLVLRPQRTVPAPMQPRETFFGGLYFRAARTSPAPWQCFVAAHPPSAPARVLAANAASTIRAGRQQGPGFLNCLALHLVPFQLGLLEQTNLVGVQLYSFMSCQFMGGSALSFAS